MTNIQISQDDLSRAAIANKTNPYADVLPLHLKMGYPEVKYAGLFLQKNEFMLYAARVSTYTEKEKFMGYKGNSVGTSVRLAKGLYVRTGGSRGKAVREKVREFTEGDLVITNKRIVFIAPENGFSFKPESITACEPIAIDALILQCGNRTKKIYVKRKELLFYIIACSQASIRCALSGYDLYSENEQLKQSVTEEQIQEYKYTKELAEKIPVPQISENNTLLSNNILTSIIIIGLLFILFLFTLPK
ncbi:MAG: hypothetical protein K2M34_04455 [Alphaproteobacteria bacterium]|nr:hypothetical protein [Alphaproteobacteria bacterium]